ncbi:hypothetical protein A6764_15130 [Brevibacillus sp. WF146]|uniref:hypothetical protein n=1 Tax=Brevibacillus sp. WF146 TaxID=319501 RepID=UPI0007ED5CE8|nr:hypothetical protein [Brevibacillus sp. WF146]UYZ12158.1 hypothetical protein A6764_15130 [Brevibacillus sp. WF146]
MSRRNKRKSNETTTKHFRGHADYKSAFSAAVTELVNGVRAGLFPDRTERSRAIEALIDEYIASTGECPDPAELERLANTVLHEELTDQRRNKLTAPEYPFMSEWQLAVRQNREYDIKLAEEIATDGRSHKPPTRRHRTARENRFVDMYAKSKNAERRRQYRKDTAPGHIISYRLNGTDRQEQR